MAVALPSYMDPIPDPGTDPNWRAVKRNFARLDGLVFPAGATNVIVKNPATSAQNVITPTADATVLTLQAFAAQVSPVFAIQDDTAANVFTVSPAGAVVAASLTLGTPLVAASGGTGFAAYTTGDLLYASGAAALSKLAIGTNGHFLKVAAGVPAWSALTSGEVTTALGFSPQPIDADLTAIAALATTGYARRSGSNTWVLDATIPIASIAAMTASRTVITDGSGNLTVNTEIGTGSHMRAISPTTTGTLTAENGTYSGTLGVTGVTSLAEALAFTANGSGGTGRIYKDAAFGLVMRGVTGSSYDFAVFNPAGNYVLRNPTGTTTVQFPGSISASNLSGTNTGDQTASSLGLGTADSPTFAGLTLSGMAGTGSRIVTVTSSGILGTGSVIAGSYVFSSVISASNLSGTNTGDQTITLTGDVTGSGTGSFATTITALPLSKMAAIAANTLLGNDNGSATYPQALSVTESRVLLGLGTASAVTFAGLTLSDLTGTGSRLLTGNSSGLITIGGAVAGDYNFLGAVGFASFSGSGSLTGNASTATTLQTARTINGVSFNGSANITVPAAAGTLTGATLAAGVTASSLTSIGTLANLDVSGIAAIGTINVNGATNTTNYRVNVTSGWVATSGTYGFRSFGVGAPTNVAAGNSESLAIYHAGASSAFIEVTKTGTGSYRSLIFTNSGATQMTLPTGGGVVIANGLSAQGGLVNTSANTVNGSNTDRGYLFIGASGGTQIQIDNNEIQAMNNTTPTTLTLNGSGGDTVIGRAVISHSVAAGWPPSTPSTPTNGMLHTHRTTGSTRYLMAYIDGAWCYVVVNTV